MARSEHRQLLAVEKAPYIVRLSLKGGASKTSTLEFKRTWKWHRVCKTVQTVWVILEMSAWWFQLLRSLIEFMAILASAELVKFLAILAPEENDKIFGDLSSSAQPDKIPKWTPSQKVDNGRLYSTDGSMTKYIHYWPIHIPCLKIPSVVLQWSVVPCFITRIECL